MVLKSFEIKSNKSINAAIGDRVELLTADFAGKKGGKGGKKNCDKGKICKGSCIAKNKTCLGDMNPQQLAAHKAAQKSTKRSGGGGGSTDPIVDPSGRKTSDGAEIELGRTAIGPELLARLDAAIAPQVRIKTPEIEKLEAAFDKVLDADPVEAYRSPEYKALQAAELKTYGVRETPMAIMSELRSSLYQISKASAEALADKVQILKSASKHEAEIKTHLVEFIQMTGGKSVEGIKKIKITGARAHADTDTGIINLGRDQTAEGRKKMLFHEFGHIVETNSKLDGAMGKWVDQRATGPAQSLNKLDKTTKYGADEFAKPDHFVDPYVGKGYPDGTEVLSMGLERMASPQAMLDFYKADPEHFYITLGAIRR